MIRRAFVRAMSCAILTSLLGVKAWRLEVSEPSEDDWELSADFGEIPSECQWRPHRWASPEFCDLNTSPRPYLR